MEEQKSQKPNVYHIRLTDNLEYSENNNHNHSGIMFVGNLHDINSLIEQKWRINHFARTDPLDRCPSSFLYHYLSEYNTSAFVYLGRISPFRVLEIDISGLTKGSLENTLKNLGLEYDEDRLRIGNPF